MDCAVRDEARVQLKSALALTMWFLPMLSLMMARGMGVCCTLWWRMGRALLRVGGMGRLGVGSKEEFWGEGVGTMSDGVVLRR